MTSNGSYSSKSNNMRLSVPRNPDNPKFAQLLKSESEDSRSLMVSVKNDTVKGIVKKDSPDNSTGYISPSTSTSRSVRYSTYSALRNTVTDEVDYLRKELENLKQENQKLKTRIQQPAVAHPSDTKSSGDIKLELQEKIHNNTMESEELLEEVRKMRESHASQLGSIEKDYFTHRNLSSFVVNVKETGDPASPVVRTVSSSFDYRHLADPDEEEEREENPRNIAWAEQPEMIEEQSKSMESVPVEKGKSDYDIYDSSRVNSSSSEDEDYDAFINDISDTMTSYSEVEMPKLDPDELFDRKKKITIAHPFKFVERESMKRASISKRRSQEYLKSIKDEEEYHLNYKFRANPVDDTILEPVLEDMSRRRRIAKRHSKSIAKFEYLRLVKPFSFDERDKETLKQKEDYREPDFQVKFRANPVPRASREKRLDKLEKANEQLRKKRIEDRAKQLYRASSLPPRMAMHESITVAKESEKQAKGMDHFPHKPKINPHVPDFSKLHHKFYTNIIENRKTKPNTEIKEFNFHSTMTSSRSDKVIEERERLEQEAKNRWRHKSYSQVPLFFKQPKEKFATTRAATLREEQIRKKETEKELRRQKKIEEDEEWKKKMNSATVRVAPTVRPRGDPKEISKQREQETMRRAREREKDSAEALERAKEEREKKLKHRPHLFETEITKKVRDSVLSEVEKTLSETGTSYLMDSLRSTK